MRVLINACYGGFGISKEAKKLIAERKGIAPDDVNDFSRDLRTDADALRIFDEMGSARFSGQFAEVKAVEIPDDVDWVISEYDGNEWIAERHRSWG